MLVAYATRSGSTQQVAEFVAKALRDQGHIVEFRPAREVGAVSGVDLVVLGAPLYSGRWHRDARRFLKRTLGHLPPVAVFGMGPRTDDAATWARSHAQLDRALSKLRGMTPVSVAVFGGVDPPGTGTGRDLRDWTSIAFWAAEVAAQVSRSSRS